MQERARAKWMNNQRMAFKEGRLSAKRISSLNHDMPGWTWTAHLDTWESNYASLSAWLSARGGKYPSKNAADDDEKLLGVWLTNQKSSYAGTRSPPLSEERVQKLETLSSFPFPMQRCTWASMLAALKKWCETHREMPPVSVHVQSRAKWLPLGRWCAQQRQRLDDEGATKDKQLQQLRQLMSRFP